MINFEADIKNCLQVLKTGGIILYPTDTVWGLGCDATNENAVAKIFSIKQREETKSMIILLEGEKQIKQYCKAPSPALKKVITETLSPLTVIYSGAKNLAANIINEDGTVAIRIVKDAFCETLIKAFGKPIVSTSANVSGKPTPKIFDEIATVIKSGANYIVQHRQRDKTITNPSKIILFKNNGEIIVIRN